MTSLHGALSSAERDGAIAVATLVLFAILALAVQCVAFAFLTKLATRHEDGVLAAMVSRMRAPSRFIFPLVASSRGFPPRRCRRGRRRALWDKNVVNVGLIDAKESTVEIRILVSARNSPDLFDLRCLVREKIIAFVREQYPLALPSTRIELSRVPEPAGVA